MPIIEITSYDVVCDAKDCDEELVDHDSEYQAEKRALQHNWTRENNKWYCPVHSLWTNTQL